MKPRKKKEKPCVVQGQIKVWVDFCRTHGKPISQCTSKKMKDLDNIIPKVCLNCGHYIDGHDPIERMCAYCECEEWGVKTT